MTLQLLAFLAREQFLAASSRESPVRSDRESLFFLHTLEHFFTLSHSLPLRESHLNIGLVIAEIKANLVRNKANKMVDKIQPSRVCVDFTDLNKSCIKNLFPMPQIDQLVNAIVDHPRMSFLNAIQGYH